MDLSELAHRKNSIRKALCGAHSSFPGRMAATPYNEMAVNGALRLSVDFDFISAYLSCNSQVCAACDNRGSMDS